MHVLFLALSSDFSGSSLGLFIALREAEPRSI